MKRFLIFLLLGFSSTAFAQNNQAFNGICSVASTTNVRGLDGIKTAKRISPEKFYAVAGDSKSFNIEINGKTKKYEVGEVSGEFGQKTSIVTYAAGKDIVFIYFRDEDGLNPIFHMEFSDGSPHTWGACEISFKKENSLIDNVASNILFDKLKSEDFIKANRVTVAGELESCEMEFQHIYKDVRALAGKPVLLTGSFSIRSLANKQTAFLLKVNAVTPDYLNRGWTSVKPKFTNIVVSKRSFLPNYHNEFTCDSGGRCAIYADPKWELYSAVLLRTSFDGQISLSLVEGGMDYSFTLSELMPKKIALIEQTKFSNCALELAKKQ